MVPWILFFSKDRWMIPLVDEWFPQYMGGSLGQIAYNSGSVSQMGGSIDRCLVPGTDLIQAWFCFPDIWVVP